MKSNGCSTRKTNRANPQLQHVSVSPEFNVHFLRAQLTPFPCPGSPQAEKARPAEGRATPGAAGPGKGHLLPCCLQGSSASFSICPMSWYPMGKVAERGLSFSSGSSAEQGQGPACLAWLGPGRTLGGLAGQHAGATEAGPVPVLQAEPIQGRELQLLQVHRGGGSEWAAGRMHGAVVVCRSHRRG